MSDVLPIECPHCAERFGFGPAVNLLSVVNSTEVNESAPCCGRKVRARLFRDGQTGGEFELGVEILEQEVGSDA